MANLREAEEMPLAYTDISLSRAYEMSFGQALKVLYTPLCGSIGKADDSIFFQGYALYLHEGRF